MKASTRCHISKPSAFTLVEVMVTTAALALLLSQAVPAVRNARSDSLLAGCQNRMGRIATAGLIYAAEDESEFATPIGDADANIENTANYTMYYNYGGKSGLGPNLDASQSAFGGALGMGAMHRPLNNILYKQVFGLPPIRYIGRVPKRDWNRDGRLDLDKYRCPADSGFSGMHYRGWRDSGLLGYDYFGTSYITSVLTVLRSEVWPLDTVSTYRRPLSTVPYPSATILYQEAAAQKAVFAKNEDLDQGGVCGVLQPWAEFVANGWHGTPYRFVVGFADGAVAQRTIQGYGRIPIPPLGSSAYRCLYVRGDGWRMDTFPSPFFGTSKYTGSTTDPGQVWEIVE